MSKRDIEPADIEALYSWFAERACESFNNHGQCSPQLAAVEFGEQPGEIAEVTFFDSHFVNAMQRNDSTKDALVAFANVLLTMVDAVVHVSEAWAVTQDTEQHVPRDLKDHPQRRTVLLVTVHTRERSYSGMSPVTDGVATPGPVFRNGKVGGRFMTHGEDETH